MVGVSGGNMVRGPCRTRLMDGMPNAPAVLLQRSCPRTAVFSSIQRRNIERISYTRNARSVAANAAVSDGTWMHSLEDGTRLEVISMGQSADNRPPIVFIHGSGHGAWCWQERFLPYFAERGFPCHAISLRAQAGSDKPPGAKSGGSLTQHADDISHFIRSNLQQAPILVGHSFGGLLTQTYVLKGYSGRAQLAGLALLSSVPPQGNQEMVGRFWEKSKLYSMKLTWAFVTKSYLRKASEARYLFFSDDLPDSDLQRYFSLLQDKQSPVPVVDVQAVKAEVPLPTPPPEAPPAFVLGGEDDRTVDVVGVKAAATHFGVQPVVLPDMAHDVMLDTRWRSAAEALETWCNSLGKSA